MQNLDNKRREEYRRIRFPDAEHEAAVRAREDAFAAAFMSALTGITPRGSTKLVLKSETVRDLSIEFTHDEIMHSSIGKHEAGEQLRTGMRDEWIGELLRRRGD